MHPLLVAIATKRKAKIGGITGTVEAIERVCGDGEISITMTDWTSGNDQFDSDNGKNDGRSFIHWIMYTDLVELV